MLRNAPMEFPARMCHPKGEEHMTKSQSGFSLIELLVAIAIIGLIVGMALPNLLGVRQRARDSQRKSESQQLKTALQLYFNDYKRYPEGSVDGDAINGCGADGASACPCVTADFAAGGMGCDTVYMSAFPHEFGTNMRYFDVNSGAGYCILATLENISDSDISVSQQRCQNICGSMGSDDYAACSE